MPSYDFACNTCKKRSTLRFATYNAYFEAVPTCLHCASTDIYRVIGRVAQAKAEGARFSNSVDDSALPDLDNADPATLGRYLRKMSEETGESLGDEFNEVVDRLERGEDPEEIEKAIPQMADPDGIGAETGGDTEDAGDGGAMDMMSGMGMSGMDMSNSAVSASGDE